MMMKTFDFSRFVKPTVFLSGLIVFSVLLFSSANSGQPSYPVTISTPNGQNRIYRLELAATPEARSRGLMYRSEIRDNAGMLFVWSDESERSFWMKNTPLSLDILFFSSEKKLISLHEETVPYSETKLLSGQPAQYVVELNAGQAKIQGLMLGSFLILPAELLRRLPQ